ncbi:MAG: transcriptional repressor [Prevotellaceae bacterium]|jgi:Fur family ferric uptake transcriptional regulator/Fur family peroxide stress response transcriptional regulator|nr:transcriptional repressor [Prevotellaceae bacterium]
MTIQTNAIDRLHEFGIKLSLQRIAVMNYLLNNYTHPAADTVFNGLYRSIPTLSKTTVYNALKLFVKHGAVIEITIDDKNVRYDADIMQHAHFQCKTCNCIYDVPIKKSKLMMIKKTGNLKITESHLYYKGYCEKCNKNSLNNIL